MALSNGFPEKMVLLDCETTGAHANHHRITELALIFVENGRITDHWQQLFNPKQIISDWITNLTGISNEMVADQPVFEMLAETLFEKLSGFVLVAHHARFDYRFLSAEFRRSGIDFTSPTLCSVKLSRALYPNQKKHGIDAIVSRLGLTIANRHRAMDDTKVIVSLFEQISRDHDSGTIADACRQVMQCPRLPSQLDTAEIDKLPNSPGIYEFYDAQGGLLYIGKSVNIKQRVLSHFADTKTARHQEIQQQLAHINFITTPSDFGAQLLENQLIKSKIPRYNRRQTKAKKLFQFALHKDAQGYQRLRIEMADLQQLSQLSTRYGLFRSQRQAKQKLLQIVQEQQLCPQLTGLEPTHKGTCFNYQLKKCRGACHGIESANRYNLRLNIALLGLKNQAWPWSGPVIVREKSVSDESIEVHYHLLDQWLYLGRVKDAHEAQHKLESETNTPRHFDLDACRIQIRFLTKLRPANLDVLTLTAFSEYDSQPWH
ncbi:DNA polymerase III epsilon subunit [Methylophaga frappieri]|uniref:Excinuclease cho n=1 Tax=Methylophaga frappieri (strain ATCC BAA-2434 / DSM 25690 / JAM7) TaxID=754477 RepID=I1YIR4_METFJ|nr:exonuclease domain-containing protein [Methylophaga frappieri]AFJ02807.1 DNA polymerase III epsilon subunit [Methylophaga frappieri]